MIIGLEFKLIKLKINLTKLFEEEERIFNWQKKKKKGKFKFRKKHAIK